MYVLSGGISGLLRKEIKSWRSKKRAPSHEANGKRRTAPIAMEDTNLWAQMYLCNQLCESYQRPAYYNKIL